LQRKVALDTGGSRGLGAATARSLADASADVAITYTASVDKAAEVVKALSRDARSNRTPEKRRDDQPPTSVAAIRSKRW
jgi:3-oxoacyl-[acyl-carrier protein] reductase